MFEQPSLPADEYMHYVNAFITESTLVGIEQVKYCRFLDSLKENGEKTYEWDLLHQSFKQNQDAVCDALTMFKRSYQRPVLMDLGVQSLAGYVSGMKIDTQTGLYLAEVSTGPQSRALTPITASKPLYI
jgi:hypothetical protein